MPTLLEVILSPAEFAPLTRRNLSRTTCVVFDVLRATTTMVTALAHGAEAIIPVSEISEALALRRQRPEVLLAGEREGLRIRAAQTGSIDFDLGNSPREFTPDQVRGRTIVMTTTNGTRALRACAGAGAALVGSFLNLGATIRWLEGRRPPHLILVCAGTREEPALEDALAAGAVCEALGPRYAEGEVTDGAEIARQLSLRFQGDLNEAFEHSRNGRRLMAIRELREDVEFCAQRDTLALVAAMRPDGSVRRQGAG
jgi:2-phosphosulfolactate phosphatase